MIIGAVIIAVIAFVTLLNQPTPLVFMRALAPLLVLLLAILLGFGAYRVLRGKEKKEKENADAYHKGGDTYDEKGEYDKAIADYNKAIELNPNDADAYYNRGCTYGEMGEYEKAIADFNKAIELNPHDAGAYYNRALAYKEKVELPKAVSDLEKCIGLSTDLELTKDAQQALYEIRKSP